MHKAVFFSGNGTAYSRAGSNTDDIDIFPETMSALRFLYKRGYQLVLVTKKRSEYQQLLFKLLDQALPIMHFNPETDCLQKFAFGQGILIRESYYISDHTKMHESFSGCRFILVLTGNGYCSMAELAEGEMTGLYDISRDIYAAAFSIYSDNVP